MTRQYTLSIGSELHGNQYKYKIEKVLGQGTFGITYLAEVVLQGQLGQLDSHAYVAVKEFFMKEINGREGTSVTSSSNTQGGLFYEYKEKFAREAKNLSKLKHPNIVKVMDYFEANNTCYYVMEYFGGGDLDTFIEKQGRLSEKETIRYTKQIGFALSFMHQNKMLHLDLKPKNVMLNSNGDAILIDFGLSKQYDSSGEPESSTTVGRGTPGYAPLEQANYQDGHGFPVTMDVYALGATMYKMLVGDRAPEASVILNDGFPEETLQLHGVSDQIVGIVKKAMCPKKKDRYQQVTELIDRIRNIESLHTEIRIDSQITSVRIRYDDGPIAEGIGYEFIVNRNGKCDFTIEDWHGKTSNIQIDSFNWQKFEQMFNLQKFRYEQRREEYEEGGSFTTIELYNGKLVTIKAEQQSGGISNIGNLVGNVSPLLNYIDSIPEIRFLIENTRNQEKRSSEETATIINPILETLQQLYNRGLSYYHSKDYEEAVKWFRKAADQGHAAAQCYLGYCYNMGQGIAQDYWEAVKWYRKAAEQGNAAAQYNLGYCFYIGQGITQDYGEAATWYQMAAEQGHADAQFYLGYCYDKGQGVIQNYGEAVRWYRKAAEQSYATAQCFLGYCYHKGQGVKQDYGEAAKWYQMAAEQGNADAQYYFGYCYDKGQGVKQDYGEAAKWYQMAAEQGNAAAQFYLGYCYDKGQGVIQNYVEAVRWYRKAAEQGYATAQCFLGYCYHNGQGVSLDYVEAAKWYRKAAEQGNADAQYYLGYCYDKGHGVTQDYVEAAKWYRMAAEQGNADAKSALKKTDSIWDRLKKWLE